MGVFLIDFIDGIVLFIEAIGQYFNLLFTGAQAVIDLVVDGFGIWGSITGYMPDFMMGGIFLFLCMGAVMFILELLPF